MKKAALGVLLALATLTSWAWATTRVQVPSLKDLAVVWLGGTPKGILEYARIHLREDGRGILTVQQLPTAPPYVYRIRATRLSQYRVSFDLEPVGSAEPIYLRGTATPMTLDLEMGGTVEKWKRNLFMETEEAVMSRIRAVTESAKSVE